MAEQVNQRIEKMINELEQMRRTNLYNDEEIKEISQKRKEFEYHLQRRVKQKADYIQYIEYELALLEDITIRREKIQLTEKKKDLEYAIVQRLNKLFKQCIYRFQDDIDIYFEYLKFCICVGFRHTVSGVIGQMLQVHGDKHKVWLLASKWESMEANNTENAKAFLIKGIQRHPQAEILYLELFEIALIELCLQAETDEEKDKLRKKAGVIWRSGVKNTDNVNYLFQLNYLCTKYEVKGELLDDIRNEIWSRRVNKEVWMYIGTQELDRVHWTQIEEFANDDDDYPIEVCYFIGIYEESMKLFPDDNLCTKFIRELVGLSDRICSHEAKIRAVKYAWMFGHDKGLLNNEMYFFGIKMLLLENETKHEEIIEILYTALRRDPKLTNAWRFLLVMKRNDDKEVMSILQNATKSLDANRTLSLYNEVLDNVVSSYMIKYLYKKFQNCDNTALLAAKPKLLLKMYEHNGLKKARELYDEFVRTPPLQIELHNTMIEIEKSQEKINLKNIRKYYECAIHHHGVENKDIWADYMKFEVENGNAANSAVVYRRAVATLNNKFVDEFIKEQTLAKIQ